MSKRGPDAASRHRMEPKARKVAMLDAAVDLARTAGYSKITREQIAEAAHCSKALVTWHYGSMIQLRRDLMRRAVQREIPEIVAQGLAANDPQAQKAPQDLKMKAAFALTRG